MGGGAGVRGEAGPGRARGARGPGRAEAALKWTSHRQPLHRARLQLRPLGARKSQDRGTGLTPHSRPSRPGNSGAERPRAGPGRLSRRRAEPAGPAVATHTCRDRSPPLLAAALPACLATPRPAAQGAPAPPRGTSARRGGRGAPRQRLATARPSASLAAVHPRQINKSQHLQPLLPLSRRGEGWGG